MGRFNLSRLFLPTWNYLFYRNIATDAPEVVVLFRHFHNKKHLKNVGPIRHCEPPHAPFTRCRYCRTPALSHAACASMSTTTPTTTTTRDRGDRYGPMEWAQSNTITNPNPNPNPNLTNPTHPNRHRIASITRCHHSRPFGPVTRWTSELSPTALNVRLVL